MISNQRELRLIEVLEELCENILKYNVHAERQGSLRYSKGESQTMSTLKGLRWGLCVCVFFNLIIGLIVMLDNRDRGVKVELGIPEDLWDTPSAEITQLKKYVRIHDCHIFIWFEYSNLDF